MIPLPAIALPRWISPRLVKTGGAVAGFFGLKLALGFALIGVSAHQLSVTAFVTFSQLFLFFALLSTIAAAGVQSGLVRQVALADGETAAEHRAIAAAFRIWAVASLAACLATTVLRHSISQLLVNGDELAGTIPLVTLVAVLGGAGMLLCSILTGRGRAPLSLALQSAGLVASGLGCVWRLHAGDPAGAVFGYAAGPLLTSMLALLCVRPVWRGVPAAELRREIHLLLSYAATFVAVAVIMPVTLFGLRYYYREAFGADLLGYWLMANRVSDVTSQLLGLYMAQIFLPHAVRVHGARETHRLMLQTLALGSAVMLGGWLAFVLAGPFFVGTFLSRQYLPAIPFIAFYLLGDGLRVSTSMAQNLMLARKRLRLYVALEAGTAILVTGFLLTLTALGRAEAPYWAYPAAHATMAAGIWLAILARPKRIAA